MNVKKFLDHLSRFMAEEASTEAASIGENMVAKHTPSGKTVDRLYDRLHIVKRSFDEELAAMIENPPHGSVPMTITPSMAADMLKRNDRNRPLKPRAIRRYVQDMRAGRWSETGEALKFSCAGRLLDGQNRLTACIEADTAFKTDVRFGLPDAAFADMDMGVKRSGSDIFAINRVPNYTLMAAAMIWVVGYDSGTIGSAARGNLILTEAQLYDEYQKHAGLQDSVWVGYAFKANRLTSPSLMLALHYICARKCRRDADDFFARLSDGVGIAGKYDPANTLRNKLISNLTSDEKLGRMIIAALTIRAWNKFRAGQTAQRLSFSSDEAFPRAR